MAHEARLHLLCDCGNRDDMDVTLVPGGGVIHLPPCSAECGRTMRAERVELLNPPNALAESVLAYQRALSTPLWKMTKEEQVADAAKVQAAYQAMIAKATEVIRAAE